eukprot:421367-Prymnesium_polylepis.1
MPPIVANVGKYRAITKAHKFKGFGVEIGDVGVVTVHDVFRGEAAKTKTDIAVFRKDDFDDFKDSAEEFAVEDIHAAAEHIYTGLNNTEMRRLFPSGEWKFIFAPEASKLEMKSVPSGGDADDGEWTGTVFRNEVPCVVGTDVELIRGGWTVLGYDAAADKYDVGLDEDDGGYATRVGTAHLERLLRSAESSTRRPAAAVRPE